VVSSDGLKLTFILETIRKKGTSYTEVDVTSGRVVAKKRVSIDESFVLANLDAAQLATNAEAAALIASAELEAAALTLANELGSSDLYSPSDNIVSLADQKLYI
jgi:hypothetical protein